MAWALGAPLVLVLLPFFLLLPSVTPRVVPKTPSSTSRLVFTTVVFRHGARAPAHIYPGSPYDEDFYAPGPGGLLEQGVQEQYELGQKLRQRYIKTYGLVSEKYKDTEVFVRSTSRNRTLASASANMDGFYANNSNSRITFVPVYTVDWDTDMLFNYRICPAKVNLLNKVYYQPLERDENNAEFFKRAREFSGYDDYWNTRHQLAFCDALVAERNLKLKQKEGADKLNDFCERYFSHFIETVAGLGKPFMVNGVDLKHELTRANGGFLLREILDRFQEKYTSYIQADTQSWIGKLKYFVYSAHDVNLATLMALMGFPYADYDNPKPMSTANALAFELWVDDSGHTTFKVQYFRRDSLNPINLSTKVRGCEHTKHGCTLNEFRQRSEHWFTDIPVKTYCEKTFGMEV